MEQGCWQAARAKGGAQGWASQWTNRQRNCWTEVRPAGTMRIVDGRIVLVGLCWMKESLWVDRCQRDMIGEGSMNIFDENQNKRV